jgi:S-adenosylmethionine-diacylgycerolhomoserine-N-methlytransferase
VKKILSTYLGKDLTRGFDTISFSYSLSMIPEWKKALCSAKSLMSPEGRVIVSDFDTYTEEGKSLKDWIIYMWYKQDGVRIQAESRHYILNECFPEPEFVTTVARFQKKLAGVRIPHYVVCGRKETVTAKDGTRRPSSTDLTQLKGEEKKQD